MMKIHIDYDMMKQDLDNVIYKDGIHNGELNKYDTDYSDEEIENLIISLLDEWKERGGKLE